MLDTAVFNPVAKVKFISSVRLPIVLEVSGDREDTGFEVFMASYLLAMSLKI